MKIWALGALVAALSLSLPAHAQTFTASSVSGVTPFSSTLTWDIPGGKDCQASGAFTSQWNGAKTPKGSQTITNLTRSGAFKLACTVVVAGEILGDPTLSWEAVTKNTDGSTLTNLKGYYIYSGTSSPPTAKSTLIPPDKLSKLIEGLTPTLWYFAITAVNTADGESELSQILPVPMGGPNNEIPWTKSIDFTVGAAQPQVPAAPVLRFSR